MTAVRTISITIAVQSKNEDDCSSKSPHFLVLQKGCEQLDSISVLSQFFFQWGLADKNQVNQDHLRRKAHTREKLVVQ